MIKTVDFPSASIAWPQSLLLHVGNALSSITLPSPGNGSFSWENPRLTFQEGAHEAVLIFTPANASYNSVKKSVTVTVTIFYHKVTVKQSKGGNLLVNDGEVTIVSGTSVMENTSLTLEAIPDKGFLFSHFVVNGVKLTGNKVNVSGELLLEAVFIPDTSTGIDDATLEEIKWHTRYGSLFIEVPVSMKLQVVAVSGKVVYNQTIMAGTTQVAQLNKGIYLLILTDSKGVSTVRKIVL